MCYRKALRSETKEESKKIAKVLKTRRPLKHLKSSKDLTWKKKKMPSNEITKFYVKMSPQASSVQRSDT